MAAVESTAPPGQDAAPAAPGERSGAAPAPGGQDVTDRERAEEALREQLAVQDQLARVAMSVPGVVYSYRLRPDGTACMPFTNAAAEDVFGLPPDVLARDMAPFMARVHPDDVQDLAARIAASARSLTRFHALFRYAHPAGGLRWIEGWSVPNAEPDGGVLWHGFSMDVTERKRAEEELRLANEKLREAATRKDEFLGMLSHELRNPLAPIRNSTYILRHAEPGSEPARRAQAVIERQTDHLTRLVDDLLDVTRIARGKIELRRTRVNLADVVRRVADDFRSLMRQRGLRFDVAVPDEPIWGDADATRVTQIVGNLLHNAAKFTRPGDVVGLSFAVAEGMAEIRIRDSGAGIEAELLPRIFEPFVQGERTLARTDGGLGLGLALVKGIAELHGGAVGADSAGKGKGTEFVVRLPLVATVDAEPEGARAGGRSASRRVLVVDDNVDAADSLADLVTLLGHPVDVAYDGPTAIEKARVHPPALVLCDIGLPGMTGYDIARALRAMLGDAQLFAVSGYAQPEDVTKAIAAGFDGHLAKPLNMADVERLLAQ